MYIFSNHLADRGKKHMEKKNINFTKDGMRVGVKGRTQEQNADKVQDTLVKTWNLSGAQIEERPNSSRTSSSASRPSTSRTNTASSQKAGKAR